MKYLVLSLLALTGSFAQAGNWEDHCTGQPAPEMTLQYPAAVLADVNAGKLTATVRKGVRCFKVGDVVAVTDPVTKNPVGVKLKLEDVIFSKFNELSPKVVAPAGQPNMEALQKQLIDIYTDTIRAETLTELYFSIVK